MKLHLSRYSSNLSRFESPIESAQNVLDRGLTLFLTNNTAFTRALFENSPIPVMRQAYEEAAVKRYHFYPGLAMLTTEMLFSVAVSLN